MGELHKIIEKQQKMFGKMPICVNSFPERLQKTAKGSIMRTIKENTKFLMKNNKIPLKNRKPSDGRR